MPIKKGYEIDERAWFCEISSHTTGSESFSAQIKRVQGQSYSESKRGA